MSNKALIELQLRQLELFKAKGRILREHEELRIKLQACQELIDEAGMDILRLVGKDSAVDYAEADRYRQGPGDDQAVS